MLALYPDFEFDAKCPRCCSTLRARRWLVPGMRNLAQAQCTTCDGMFYVDLPAGQASLTPVIMDARSGEAFSSAGAGWFAQWLSDSYARRRKTPPAVREELFRTLRRPILLNCLDTLYGHELMKLMNAQYYLDSCVEKDLVVLIHANFRWLVPNGVAAIWTLQEPLSKGTDWNDGLAEFVRSRLTACEEAWLARAVNLPHADDFDIERFTGVKPFPRGDFFAWVAAMQSPKVVFVCRDDRGWFGGTAIAEFFGRVARGLSRRGIPLRGLVRLLQHRAIAAFGSLLRREYPGLEMTVIGVGQPGGLHGWIKDLRSIQPTDENEVETCRCCAEAHLVIGVHGSNMLIPTAHAGAVIDLMPRDRWDNIGQDIVLPMGEAREQALRAVFLPTNTTAGLLAHITSSTLRYAHHILRIQTV